MSIKEFGRRSGLSHKALRLYDLSGLLSPAQVAATGYRYYHPDQLERARRISLLRQLDMPLATVAEVLTGTDEEAAQRLELWWAGQEAAQQARQRVYAYLRTRLVHAERAEAGYPVTLRTVPAVKVATITHVVDQAALVEMMIASEQKIRRYLAESGAVTTVDHWAIFHGYVTPDSEAPVEICVPFTGTLDPYDDITIRLEPAQTQAYCTVARDDCYFPQIMAAYESVYAWVLDHGRRSAGAAREMYFARWDAIAGTDPFVDVAMPVHDPARTPEVLR
jgi:DNA-binding transcriptional MerR regulator